MSVVVRRHRRKPAWSRHRERFERVAIATACLALALFLFAFESRAVGGRGELRVWFFDVGQGDATFIVTPTGEQVLVDGGPDRAVLAKLGQVMPPWDRTIDVVVATHPDADHVGGLAAVLERYEVGRVIANGDAKDTSVAAAFEVARLAEPGARLDVGRRGDGFELGGVAFEELWPVPSALRDADANVASIVYRVSYGEASVLLMGDATEGVEGEIIARGTDGVKGTEGTRESNESEDLEDFFGVDVLKAGHHGSAGSSSYGFVRAVRPEAAIISCGEDNRYGHPHPVVLDRLVGVGARIFRTDLDGDVLLTSDGGEPVVRAAALPF